MCVTAAVTEVENKKGSRISKSEMTHNLKLHYKLQNCFFSCFVQFKLQPAADEPLFRASITVRAVVTCMSMDNCSEHLALAGSGITAALAG